MIIYLIHIQEDESENISSNSSGKTLPDINLSYGNRDTCILEVFIIYV